MVHSSVMAGRLATLGLILLGVVAVVAAAGAAVFLLSNARTNATVDVGVEPIAIPTAAAAVQHGQHISGAIAVCTRCHGSNLGGAVVEDDAAARVVAPNLTRGGVAANFSDADYVRAIRHGLDPLGHPLLLMPTADYIQLSDADLAALIAYLKALPSTTSALPSSEVRPLGRLLLAVGQTGLLPSTDVNRAPPPPAPSPGDSPAYGAYVAGIAGCARCHGPGLSGGSVPGAPKGAPPASNLTPAGLGDWSEADFLRAMRSGRRPDGSTIDPSMPWPYYAQMSDLELRAIWEYLGVVPARPSGSH
jgi:cytochrome c553